MLSCFPRDVFDKIWDLIGSVSEGFPTDFVFVQIGCITLDYDFNMPVHSELYRGFEMIPMIKLNKNKKKEKRTKLSFHFFFQKKR